VAKVAKVAKVARVAKVAKVGGRGRGRWRGGGKRGER